MSAPNRGSSSCQHVTNFEESRRFTFTHLLLGM